MNPPVSNKQQTEESNSPLQAQQQACQPFATYAAKLIQTMQQRAMVVAALHEQARQPEPHMPTRPQATAQPACIHRPPSDLEGSRIPWLCIAIYCAARISACTPASPQVLIIYHVAVARDSKYDAPGGRRTA